MKSNLINWVIFALLNLNSLLLFGQASFTKKQYKYQFAVECPIQKCTINGKKIDSSEFVAPPGSKFIVVDAKGDILIIRFFISNKWSNDKSIISDDYNSYSYYLISKFQFEFKAFPLGTSDYDIVFGSVYTPMKIRAKPFDFTKDFTVGTTFGIRKNIDKEKQLGVDLLLGVGLSSISLDSFSTSGKVNRPIEVLSFTPALGIVSEVGNAQVGIFCGTDLLNSQNDFKYNWLYQGKLWWSFGIGYSLLSFGVKK